MSEMIRTKKMQKRPYSSPTLTVFGSVTKLTASGTKGNSESGSATSNKVFP